VSTQVKDDDHGEPGVFGTFACDRTCGSESDLLGRAEVEVGPRSQQRTTPLHVPNCVLHFLFKPSLRYVYPLNPPNSASRPIRDIELMMVFSLTNQGR